MGYSEFLKALYPSSHNVDGEVYSVILGAIGFALDQYDPNKINLASEFSVTASSGDALGMNGLDWGVTKKIGESDDSFKQRTLSLLPLYSNGPKVDCIKTIVSIFTGVVPIVFEYGPGAFVMGESAIDGAGFCSEGDVFTFEIHIQNPNNVSYNHQDLENAVQKAKLARSTAIIFHNGTDTSPAAEQSNSMITVM